MRHQKTNRKFGRKVGDRKSFLKGLVHNLAMKEKITTTLSRAKELQKVVAPFITLGKKQTLASYRLLLQRLPKKSVEKIYKDISPRMKDRRGGYTRIVRLTSRMRDASPMAIISFVENEVKEAKK